VRACRERKCIGCEIGERASDHFKTGRGNICVVRGSGIRVDRRDSMLCCRSQEEDCENRMMGNDTGLHREDNVRSTR